VLNNLAALTAHAGAGNTGGSTSGPGSTGGSTAGSPSTTVTTWLMGIITSQQHSSVNVTTIINMLRGNNAFPGMGGSGGKRQQGGGSATNGGSVDLTTLFNLGGNLGSTQNGEPLQTRCQQLSAVSHMKRQPAHTTDAWTSAALNATGSFAGVIALCANLTLPATLSNVQQLVQTACQSAANLAGNCTATTNAGAILQHTLNVSTAIHGAATALQTTVTAAQNAIASCQQTLSTNTMTLAAQMMQTVAMCQGIGASVQSMLGAGFTPGGQNSGATISTALQTQIQTCQSQLAMLRAQFATAASSCPGVVSAVRCVKRHPLLLNVTISGGMNCTDDFIRAVQNGAAAFVANVNAYCSTHTCSAQAQASFAAAQLTLTNASAPSTSDPTTASDAALCRRDISFQCSFADPSNVAPATTSGGTKKRDTRDSDDFSTELQSFSDACVGMTSCTIDSSSPPPVDAPDQTVASASVPPIAGIDDVTVTSSQASTNAATDTIRTRLAGDAATFSLGVVAVLVALVAFM